MTSDADREIGELTARMASLEKTTAAIQTDMREVRDTIISAKGGWKILAAIAGIAGAVGALMAKLGPWIFYIPK